MAEDLWFGRTVWRSCRASARSPMGSSISVRWKASSGRRCGSPFRRLPQQKGDVCSRSGCARFPWLYRGWCRVLWAPGSERQHTDHPRLPAATRRRRHRGDGAIGPGGVVLAATAVFDAFDGALARQRGGATTFGAFLDSNLDRLAESGILLGLAWYLFHQPGQVEEFLVYVALVGSWMVSYARARAEGWVCSVRTDFSRASSARLPSFWGWYRDGWCLCSGSWRSAPS